MICAYCGTELPAAAMFCGECGRAVATKAAAKARPRVPLSTSSSARWPSLVAEHQVDPMVALSEQPGLVEVDLLASGPIVIPVTAAPADEEPVADRPADEVPEQRERPVLDEPERQLPEVLVAAALAKEASEERERNAHSPAVAVSAHSDEPSKAALPEFDSGEFDEGDPSEHPEFCQQCGAELAASDIFCGECGFVRRAPDLAAARPRDTATYDPFPWGTPRSTGDSVADEPEPVPGADVAAEPIATPAPAPAAPAPAAPAAAAPAAAAPAAAVPAGAPLAAAAPAAADEFGAPRDRIGSPDIGDAPDALELDDPASRSDVEKTRIVDRPARGDAFILQFSTGENITVSGTGLIGRNPLAEPGEYFDSLVSIVDPGKSVSKTHLEFGQDGGQFWISDRYSANGTVVREPDRPARRGEAGKRYRVVRGTRVDIGEQFFIVS